MLVEENEVRNRKAYEKPRIESVELKAGEAVLSNCKATQGLFGNWNTTQCNWLVDCRTVGS